MTSDSTVISLRQPDTVDDPLTAVLLQRTGTHRDGVEGHERRRTDAMAVGRNGGSKGRHSRPR